MNSTARTWAVGGVLALALGLVHLKHYKSTRKPRQSEKSPEEGENEEAARKQTNTAEHAAPDGSPSPCPSSGSSSRGPHTAAALPHVLPLFTLSPLLEAVEVMPGVVHLKRALDLNAQLAVCDAALHVGHAERR
jgi:hypothetical protein